MLKLCDYKFLSFVFLKKMCMRVKIKNISKMNKLELFNTYNKYLASIVIQKIYRTHLYKNAIDHITLEPVKYPCFIFHSKPNKLYFYEYETIIKYIMKTGDTRDPMTRTAYSDEDLIRLDREVKIHFPNLRFRSTFKIKKNINYARRIRNRENEILSFQLRLNELKMNVMIAIESNIFSWDINEPFNIDNIQYSSVSSYINSIVHEIKIILLNLNHHDHDSALIFKEGIVNDIRSYIENEPILEVDHDNNNNNNNSIYLKILEIEL